MSVSQTIETEEDLLTCLHIHVYNPQQTHKSLYALLPLGVRKRHPADDPLRLGRDAQACSYALVDPRVSRKQLAVQAYRAPHNPNMQFSIQNLSQKGRLAVNSSTLGFLEKMELPDKALIRFGEYEMLMVRESGEAKASYEVKFEVLTTPPSRETCACAAGGPVMDSEMMSSATPGIRMIGPLETDETLTYP